MPFAHHPALKIMQRAVLPCHAAAMLVQHLHESRSTCSSCALLSVELRRCLHRRLHLLQLRPGGGDLCTQVVHDGLQGTRGVVRWGWGVRSTILMHLLLACGAVCMCSSIDVDYTAVSGAVEALVPWCGVALMVR
jgi:hypothetical protein